MQKRPKIGKNHPKVKKKTDCGFCGSGIDLKMGAIDSAASTTSAWLILATFSDSLDLIVSQQIYEIDLKFNHNYRLKWEVSLLQAFTEGLAWSSA